MDSSDEDKSEGIFILTMNLIKRMMWILFNSLHKHLNYVRGIKSEPLMSVSRKHLRLII